MKSEQLLDEIRDANLTYLLLAQQMIRADKVQALYRLGIDAEMADMLVGLSTGQILKIAATSLLLCRFRFDEQIVWNLLTSHSEDRAKQTLANVHAAILMAEQPREVG
jgi:flagellar transcriptional activator FlhD